MILALINSKGGVAKTTSAVNLAAGIAHEGYTTLLVDLDSQCSASLSLGMSRNDLRPSIADVMFADVPVQHAIRPTTVPGLSILPASIELASADINLANVEGREECLTHILSPLRTEYEYIILDCPPSLAMLPVNALIAADALLVPISIQYLALEGLATLLEAIEHIRANIGARAELLGIVLTMVDYRTKITAEVIDMIRREYGRKVLDTEIRTNVRLAWAPSHGETIFSHDPSSTGAHAYKQLTAEVLKRARAFQKKKQ